ncbi:hypothetical protein JOQ06_017954, partial [Pogonophryne albipinna]
SVYLPGPRRAGRSEIKVSPIPRCKQRGVNSLQDDRCLQSAGYYSFLCRFSPLSSPKEKQPFPATPLPTSVGVLSESPWVCLQSPPCPPPIIITTTSFFPFPPIHPLPSLVVLSGAVNEKDWTDTIGRRRALSGAPAPACVY